jgi:hypothetical protein
MNKLIASLALAAGLTMGLAATTARAASIDSLNLADMSASQFNSLFKPIAADPVLSSPFTYYGAPESGSVVSQVFAGTGSAQGLYAYAYQYDLNNVSDSNNTPIDLRGTSWGFNSTPVGTKLTTDSSGNVTGFTQNPAGAYAYAITDGAVGGIGASVAAAGQSILKPTQLNWEPNTNSGSLLATYFDPTTNVPALQAGAHSATFVVLTSTPPTTTLTGILGSAPLAPGSTLVPTYAASLGDVKPHPIPEPATILAWAGMAGAVALVRRVRQNRRAV